MNSSKRSGYYDGLNEKLLAAIPPGAQNIIEFGCASGRLAEAYKSANPSAHWTGVDIDPGALSNAQGRVDLTIAMDLDHPEPDLFNRKYDVIVMGGVLEHLRDPTRLLSFARLQVAGEGHLVCCIPNMCHASVLERFLGGDVCYDDTGLLDNTHLRFLSHGSVFKMLLDTGWLPEIRDSYTVGHPNANYVEQLLRSADALGLPRSTALGQLLTYQYIIGCIARPPPPRIGAVRSFTVVVPVNRRHQFHLNVPRSPGLAEVGAQILAVEGSASAAEALERGRARATNEWIVFCHQDVYFPKGSGIALCQELAGVADGAKRDFLMGFAGMDLDSSGAPRKTGLVIDRTYRFDYPASRQAISLDELAVVLHRDGANRIDPQFGWHLWATDLCLQGLLHHGKSVARIARIPLFHNSYGDGTLPASFHESANKLAAKYPQYDRITTLCIEIRRSA